ncbi:glycerophosphodiester phosphodiesterase [Paenibacillus sanguinis]|uniref:glycerophosphodiester phosphodiesterase n=1 Tax=Paenibacillus sanguinis TaxID=225906 RepID=UPI0003626D0A|nr:glycerophosphodiester phosphodiesterase [Paenibacillus sanguinis]
MNPIINFAHRGASGYYPENTILSFAKAMELGATGIETDVQVTKDGHLVLIHDETLQRTGGTQEWVKDLTLAEIKEREVGGWLSLEFEGEEIPTLEDLLELVKGTDIIINLELKTGIVMYPGIEQKVTDAVRHFGLSGQTIISSFNHYSLVECKRLAPEIRTGILYMEGLYEPWVYAKGIGADALHAYQYALIPELVVAAKAAGVVYHPFTVNDPKVMQALLRAGVAGIITDYPDRLAELLQKPRG